MPCIVCGGRLRTISEDGDQECTVSPDHGYDDLVPPPVPCMWCAHPTDDPYGECATCRDKNARKAS